MEIWTRSGMAGDFYLEYQLTRRGCLKCSSGIVRWTVCFMGKNLPWSSDISHGERKIEKKISCMLFIIPDLDDFKSPFALRFNENMAKQKGAKG